MSSTFRSDRRRSGLIVLTGVLCLSLLLQVTTRTSSAQNESALLASLPSSGEAAFVDAGFNPLIGGLNSFVSETLVQPDGKILVAGDFKLLNNASRAGIARFNADGSVDTTFNTGSGGNDAVFGIGLQSDGRIVISGLFTSYNGVPVGRIARLNPDGTLDQTFNTTGVGANANAGGNGEISDVKVLSDNRIMIGGTFTSYNGVAQNRIARLSPNGSLDTTFAVGTGAISTVLSIDIQLDGKVVIGGNFASFNGTPSQRIARLNTDGSLDSTFASAAAADFTIRNVTVLPDQSIIAAGLFQSWGGLARNGIAKLRSDGVVDQTFTVSGLDAAIYAVAPQSDGKIVIGGSFTSIAGGTRGSIARVNADGTLDSSFDPGTGINPDVMQDLALQGDGKIIAVGTFTAYNGVARGGIARINPNGSLDNTLQANAIGTGTVSALATQNDGKVLIGGNFSSVNGTAAASIGRLNPDGSLDPTFVIGTGMNGSVAAIAVQADGKILVGGSFTSYNSVTANRLVRLNTDGSVDTSFNVGTAASGEVNAIVVQPSDGRVLIGGGFVTFNGTTVNRIARLNTDGTLDTAFTAAAGTAANSTVRAITVQPDSKILVGGQFSTFNGASRPRLTRLNSDGSADAGFTVGTGPSSTVIAIALRGDGKIVIGGSFTNYNGAARSRIASVNADGTLDTDFNPGTGGNFDVTAIVPVENNRVLITGIFTLYNGMARNRIARINPNGSYDTTFVSGLGAFATTGLGVRAMIRQADGKILIGGQFSQYNASARAGLARFSNVTDTFCDFDGDGKTDFGVMRRLGPISPWTWWLKFSGTGSYTTFTFGLSPRDLPQPGDFDGDGKDDVAVWRNTALSGEVSAYYIIQSSTNTIRVIPFGQAGDTPVVEDYDGDGKDDPSVWRAPSTAAGPGQATWFYLGSANNPNNNITYVPWGMRYGTQSDQVDEPYPGDVDGDGKSDFTLQRRADITVPSSGTPATFHILTATGSISYQDFGLASDRIVPGDYDGDGKTDLAVVRGFNISPSQITWFIRYSGGQPDEWIPFGQGSNFNMSQGDYDGDGKTDIALLASGLFWWRAARDGNVFTEAWGSSGDFSVAAYNNR